MTYNLVSVILTIVVMFIGFLALEENIKIINANTLNVPVTHTQQYTLEFQESVAGIQVVEKDNLFIERSVEGFPVLYFRKFSTGVCLENECRPLLIILYWTVTGRYLGFELPQGEFLSKTEHEPFVKKEYEELNKLLSNSYSTLANFSLEELVEPVTNEEEVDGVSGATRSGILDYCVDGAVFTTYTLWHLVYGDTRRKIIDNTKSEMTPELLELILESNNKEDRKWALSNSNKFLETSKSIQDKIFDLIDKGDELSGFIIEGISQRYLEVDSIQEKFYSEFKTGPFSVKRAIIKKLSQSGYLTPTVKRELVLSLEKESNDRLIGEILDMLFSHGITEKELLRSLTSMLEHENIMVSHKTFSYLNGLNIKDREIEKRLKIYLSDK